MHGRTHHFPLICLIFLACFSGCASDAPTERPYRIISKYSVTDPEFKRTIGNLLGPPFVGGNSTATLLNGDEIFPAMLDAVRSAHQSINFETYVYWSGKVGAQFAEALSERAAKGVAVHVIIDGIGSDRIDQRYINQMQDSGVQVVRYHPLRWYEIGWTWTGKKFNNRTHRKLLIVDGQTGFTGGVGIADMWLGDADSPEHWRDTHYVARGPIVSQMQSAFVDNWMETTGKVLHGDVYFPAQQDAGSQWAQVFKSSPQGGSESMELMYLLSIAAAQKNIRLASAYFVPDKLTVQSLIDARERGVTVQIVVPGRHIDEKIVRPASRSRWGDLLKAGVEIYEYEPTMYHCKQMIIDDAWVSIGSANLDNLSFKKNDEANMNILDPVFAAEQIRIFNEDLGHADKITYEQWSHRPIEQVILDVLAWPLGGFL